MNRRHQQNNFFDSIKDYIVPIIGIFLVLFLMYSFFFSGNDEGVEDVENRVGVNLEVDSTSNAKVFFSNGKSEEVTSETELYKWERVVVSEWRLQIAEADYTFNIDKLGEVSYIGDKNFAISSGKVWLDNKVDMNIDMEFLKAKVSKDSHISFIQNEVISTIYVISGMAEVSSNTGSTVILSSGEKLEISRKDSANEEIDFNLQKQGIDDIFKASEWYTINGGANYENLEETEETAEDTEETAENITPESATSSTEFITFNNLIDNSTVSTSPMVVYGMVSDGVKKITVNGTNEAKIIAENNSFSIEGITLPAKENDLIFKVYDGSNNELEKFVYTINYSGKINTGTTATTPVTTNSFSGNAEDFTFTAPTTDGLYTGYEDLVTIKGKVTDSSITKVTVNDYKLSSFNGSSWLYHANKEFGNMSDGTNQYEIKYYAGEKLVYKNYFTIVHKTESTSSSE